MNYKKINDILDIGIVFGLIIFTFYTFVVEEEEEIGLIVLVFCKQCNDCDYKRED